jgi:hypothetical protein
MNQAESRARPLARRFLITARPPRVLIRARNPCFFARRWVLGWNVRFTSSSSTTRLDAVPGRHETDERDRARVGDLDLARLRPASRPLQPRGGTRHVGCGRTGVERRRGHDEVVRVSPPSRVNWASAGSFWRLVRSCYVAASTSVRSVVHTCGQWCGREVWAYPEVRRGE